MKLTTTALLALLALPVLAAEKKGPSPDDQYKKFTADSLPQPGVPQGAVTRFTWSTSKIFPGTSREVMVYVPKQYNPAKPACVFVCQDGHLYAATNVFNNLIARREMPVTIGIFIKPGMVAGQKPGEKPRNRSAEYDTLGDTYARFILEEMLPEVGKKYNLTKDPAGRCIAGSSSGGICAWTVCWERPDEFRKCFTTVGSFTNIRGGNKYPELVRSAPKKPIRIFQQDGANDIVNQFGSWPEANKAMAKALDEKGYDHKFVFGEGVHSGNHGTQIFPEVMRWMWRDYPK
ncbi:MAG: esterase family protein [Verrucomicrobia bacterium]|nr:esterase family protein [Verrucomicrobiota bacterium]